MYIWGGVGWGGGGGGGYSVFLFSGKLYECDFKYQYVSMYFVCVCVYGCVCVCVLGCLSRCLQLCISMSVQVRVYKCACCVFTIKTVI